LSSTTVHHLHATLHKALEAALRLDLVTRNVTERVEVPRVRQSEMRVLTRDEARRFLLAASGDTMEALFTLALATGMRQGELLGLRWRDVDLDAEVV